MSMVTICLPGETVVGILIVFAGLVLCSACLGAISLYKGNKKNKQDLEWLQKRNDEAVETAKEMGLVVCNMAEKGVPTEGYMAVVHASFHDDKQ